MLGQNICDQFKKSLGCDTWGICEISLTMGGKHWVIWDFLWIFLIHFYKSMKRACMWYDIPELMPASDSSQQKMLTERVQEAVTYFFHFSSLSIHHCFRHNRVWSLMTLPFMFLRISLVNPFRSWCFWPLQLHLAMNLEKALCMSPSWAPLRWPPMAGAASLHSIIVAPYSTFLLSHNLWEKDGGGW